jgi:aconitate hydratase
MADKIFAGRHAQAFAPGDRLDVKVDHVALTRDCGATLRLAKEAGIKASPVEVAVAYAPRAIDDGEADAPATIAAFVAHGITWARSGVGYAAAVHLERFAGPSRICVTDDPRLIGLGGMGMLTYLLSSAELARALTRGTATVQAPRTVQVLVSGKTRPFVNTRDVAFELLRRGLRDKVERAQQQSGAPVVLEFGGPSVRLLSVPDRALLASMAPEFGAMGALFPSDERAESFLRDERRSKAHRVLHSDPGASCADVMSVDMALVDPLLMDEKGTVRTVRELNGTPIRQAVLGGDFGAPLRDLASVAALLASKRVLPSLDLLLAWPSRQVLEVLASTGALQTLIATGVRLVEPDRRALRGDVYAPPEGGISIRTTEVDPSCRNGRVLIASPETVAFAAAAGQIGDPRGFKRPPRVTLPRELPTDDVLIIRDKKQLPPPTEIAAKAAAAVGVPSGKLTVVEFAKVPAVPGEPIAVIATSTHDGLRVADLAWQRSDVRAVVVPYLSRMLSTALAQVKVAALVATPEVIAQVAKKGSLDLGLSAGAATLGGGLSAECPGHQDFPAGAVPAKREAAVEPKAKKAR